MKFVFDDEFNALNENDFLNVNNYVRKDFLLSFKFEQFDFINLTNYFIKFDHFQNDFNDDI